MSASDLVELDVRTVGAQGDGVAEGPRGPVFAPLTLPGERVRAKLNGDRAEVVEILNASPDRIAPVSPHYGACGGCSLQHWAAEPYLAWKREQVRLALLRERLEPEILPVVATPPASRRRLALHARQCKGRDAAIGFKARRSWSLVEVETCPIARPEIVAAFPGLRRLANAFFEHPKSAPTLHVTWTLSGLDVDVTGVEARSGGLSADARMTVAETAAAADFARVTMGGEILYQARPAWIRFGKATVALPPGGFLQAVEEAEAAMVGLTTEAVGDARFVADLFCGAGAFAFRLAERANVLAADSAAPAITALKAALGSAPGLKPVQAEARDLFRRPLTAEEMKRCEAIVFDPPRAGAAAQTAEIARSAAAVVVGVSCNPATFARDAASLTRAGFRLETVTPVDQFLWSSHVELVGVFRR